MVNRFPETVDTFGRRFYFIKQLFNAKVLVDSLSSFIVPKIMVVRHV